ncbi:MAG TPA: hypothetical protein DCX32_02640 [Candidatus Moranbacteria bacterium]|nr:hypothetical protein [Candidatus Moranbacteria bacterium]
MQMILGFFEYSIWGSVFFFGTTGIGLLLFDFLKLKYRNIWYKLSISYFLSLCLFIFLSVAPLFFVPDKLLFLRVFTVAYSLLSLVVILLNLRKKDFKLFFKKNWKVFAALLLSLVSFFLVIFQTSVLDEWLHRPVVKYFTTNGTFPLVNPYNPSQNFIFEYHYGMHIFASEIQLISNIGVSESLDVSKVSYFIATFLLFYGLILTWSKKRNLALFGAVVVLFAGSSFFLVDAFTTEYFNKIKWLDQQWVMNSPFAFILSGVTWVNISLGIAFVFIARDLFLRKLRKTNISFFLVFIAIFTGYFMITELFALLTLLSIGGIFAYHVFTRKISLKEISLVVGMLALILWGVYLTGGVMGKMIGNVSNSAYSRVQSLVQKPESENVSEMKLEAKPVAPAKKKLLDLKPIRDWGYPSEKGILRIWEHPVFYLRNFLLEIAIVGLFAYLYAKKKITFKDQPVIIPLLVVTFAIPFFYASSMMDLNLYKLTNFGIVLLHLFGFYLLTKVENRKILYSFLTLFTLGALPGIFLGTNVQWDLFSSKGKSMRCSQNPSCYKPETVEMFEEFEKENPGIKKVLTSTSIGDAQKVVDLSNSEMIRIGKVEEFDDVLEKGVVEYVYATKKLREVVGDEKLRNDVRLKALLIDGNDEILKLIK